jgi:hypothetical protein
MPIPKQVCKTFVLLVVLTALAAPLAAKPGDAIPPTTMVFTSTAQNEILTQGKTFTYTTADGTFSLLNPGVYLFLASGGDQNTAADIRFDVRDVGRYAGDFIKGRAYENTIGEAFEGAGKGPYMSASIGGRNCNDPATTTGRFEIVDYQWQKVYYPKGTKLEPTDTVGLPDDRILSFAITRFQAAFELRCNGEPSSMTGFVDFYGEKAPVPPQAVEFLGPVEPCFNPILVTSDNPGCTGSPGGSGQTPGGNAGGPTFPTVPPSRPAPDVKLVLPPSLVDLPALQLTNSSSTSFTFSTFPVSDTAGSDVNLSIETDANEGDGFTATITPDFIAAPGAGQATVSIGVGPNTFPRDYRVTVTATANGKTSSSTFIVTVQCDPPMILGIDQPQNQTVNRNSPANLTVKATGSGPFVYQWYSGRRGNTRTPIAGATSATYTTPAVTGANSYWVRVSNPCGTVDSNSVSVSPR